MREIKFRAWVNCDKQNYTGMYSVIELSRSRCVVERASVFAQTIFALTDVTLMQFTGLKDKNGKEIYEGDIVKFNDITEPETIIINAIVEWDKCRCSLHPREIDKNHKGGRYWHLWDFCTEIEIIGNIYGNLEPEGGHEKNL